MCKSISTLLYETLQISEFSFWVKLSTYLKKIRFELLTLPLPYYFIIDNEKIEKLNQLSSGCSDFFPDHKESVDKIINKIKDCRNLENNLFEYLKERILENTTSTKALCLTSRNYIKKVKDFILQENLFKDSDLKIIYPLDLKKPVYFEQIYFCSSISYYSLKRFNDYEYIWRAPRSQNLFFHSYSFFNYRFEPKQILNPDEGLIYLNLRKETIKERKKIYSGDSDIGEWKEDLEEIIYSPFEDIKEKFAYDRKMNINEDEVDAHLAMFQDESFVFLPVNGSVMVVKTDFKNGLNKKFNKDLEPEDIIILRTEGSDDSIESVADLLLKENAESIRSTQKEWKSAFIKRHYDYSGFNEIASELNLLGGVNVNASHVRNWLDFNNIKPQKKEDFYAIMKFIGFEKKSEIYFENARKIDSAHKQAGKNISRLLRKQVGFSQDIHVVIDIEGRVNFKVDGLSGQISALRIDSIEKNPEKIPQNKVNRIFTKDEI
ncbi:MAG: hypothetical protein ACQESP_12000 [Candidatus Muiribacteriota bacterium]